MFRGSIWDANSEAEGSSLNVWTLRDADSIFRRPCTAQLPAIVLNSRTVREQRTYEKLAGTDIHLIWASIWDRSGVDTYLLLLYSISAKMDKSMQLASWFTAKFYTMYLDLISMENSFSFNFIPYSSLDYRLEVTAFWVIYRSSSPAIKCGHSL